MKDLLVSVFGFFYEIFSGAATSGSHGPSHCRGVPTRFAWIAANRCSIPVERMEPLTAREIRRARSVDGGEIKILPQAPRRPQLVPSADTESDAVA